MVVAGERQNRRGLLGHGEPQGHRHRRGSRSRADRRLPRWATRTRTTSSSISRSAGAASPWIRSSICRPSEPQNIRMTLPRHARDDHESELPGLPPAEEDSTLADAAQPDANSDAVEPEARGEPDRFTAELPLDEP